jgi:hypothetical protein
MPLIDQEILSVQQCIMYNAKRDVGNWRYMLWLENFKAFL